MAELKHHIRPLFDQIMSRFAKCSFIMKPRSDRMSLKTKGDQEILIVPL